MTHLHRFPVGSEIRPLSRSERLAANNWRRTLRVSAHAGLARLFGGAEMLERMLDRALVRRDRGAPAPFAVPLPFALSVFGETLCIDVPTALLGRRLADWVGHKSRSYHVSDYFLGFGDWEHIAFPFAQTGVMREAVELLQANLDYRRTRSFRIYRERIDAGSPVRRNKVQLSSVELLESYFQRYVALFQSIREYGVVPLRTGAPASAALTGVTDVRPFRAVLGERDIGVAIGSGGAIYALPGGKHRAAIATVLGLATVPVEVRLIHAEWLSRATAENASDAVGALAVAIARIAHGATKDEFARDR